MVVVTISRQYGCSGPEIGRAAAEILGARYVDRELIARAAQRIGVPEDILSERDERIRGLIDRLLEATGLAFTGVTGAGRGALPSQMPPIPDAQLLYVTRALIKEIAKEGNAVIVGRGSQVVLAGQKNTLHVHIVAPLPERVRFVMSREALSAEEAKRLIARIDGDRAAYLRTNYQVDWEDPLLYHFVINTGLTSQEQAVQLIVVAATAIGKTAGPPHLAGQAEEEGQHLLWSLQTMRDSARTTLERVRQERFGR